MFQSNFFRQIFTHSNSAGNSVKSFFNKIFNRFFRSSDFDIDLIISDIQEMQETVRQKRSAYENWKKSESAKTENCVCGKLKFSVPVHQDANCANQELIDRCNQLDLVFTPPKLLTGFSKNQDNELSNLN